MERKLSHNELAQAVGGSYQEMMELKAAIFANPNLKPIWDKYMAKTGDDLDATAWTVSETLNLGFTASYGISGRTTPLALPSCHSWHQSVFTGSVSRTLPDPILTR